MIREIIILTRTGVPIFQKRFGSGSGFGSDVSLISGFISAVNTFAQELTSSSVQIIEMGKMKLVFHMDDVNCIHAIVCDISDEMVDVGVIIRKIAETFQNMYASEVEQYKGDIRVFRNFDEVLEKMDITGMEEIAIPDAQIPPT
ncbi:unnamed protein product, partial [marine sediment metagenome]